ncbi:hypothetical protein ACFONG_18065 [Uliginosibacterium paludis]|uniref:Uncharacterized protein n=1 Tax=Uliginosibacterium paludis TaxID=1615952 RepID=A0ABV2CRW0_9RHOO
MSHFLSKADIDRRSLQLNHISPQYYRKRGYLLQDATALAALTLQRLQIEASHLKQTQKRESD